MTSLQSLLAGGNAQLLMQNGETIQVRYTLYIDVDCPSRNAVCARRC